MGSFFGQLACCDLERSLGTYPVGESAFWTPPDHWDADDIVSEMTAVKIFLPVVGLRLLALVFICLPPKLPFEGAVWGVAEEYGDARLERCRALKSVPGPIWTVQRAELWGAIIASAVVLTVSFRY